MKKALFIILGALAFGLKSQSSVYHPFPDSSAHWCETWSYGSNACYTEEDYTLSLQGDTLINGKTYHKIYSSGKAFPPSCPYPPSWHYNTYYGAIREDIAQKKVYNANDDLVYDFTLLPGNSVPNFLGGSNAIITSIDSILIGIDYRRQFWVGISGQTHADSNWYSIIEGIGSSVGLFLAPQQGPESVSKLKSFEQNGITLYNPDVNFQCNYLLATVQIENRSDFSVFPNPANGTVFISLPTGATSVQIKNSLGETVEGRFVTGKKMHIDFEESGIYYIQLITEKQAVTKKIIICK